MGSRCVPDGAWAKGAGRTGIVVKVPWETMATDSDKTFIFTCWIPAALTLVLDMQWLVFRKDGATTAGQWAQEAAQYVSQSGFLAVFDRGKAQRQQAFVKEILRQTMKVRPTPSETSIDARQHYKVSSTDYAQSPPCKLMTQQHMLHMLLYSKFDSAGCAMAGACIHTLPQQAAPEPGPLLGHA